MLKNVRNEPTQYLKLFSVTQTSFSRTSNFGQELHWKTKRTPESN